MIQPTPFVHSASWITITTLTLHLPPFVFVAHLYNPIQYHTIPHHTTPHHTTTLYHFKLYISRYVVVSLYLYYFYLCNFLSLPNHHHHRYTIRDESYNYHIFLDGQRCILSPPLSLFRCSRVGLCFSLILYVRWVPGSWILEVAPPTHKLLLYFESPL